MKSLQKCHYDVKRISNCFVSMWKSDVEVLTKWTKNPVVNQFLIFKVGK